MENDTDREFLKDRIKTALQEAQPHTQIDDQYVEWLTDYLTSIASALTTAEQSEDFKGFFKSVFAQETSEYDPEELKSIRQKQSQSKTIDDIVKRKDELAKSIKEGKIDIDRVIHLAAQGDIQSLITILPYFQFGFQTYQPTDWDLYTIHLYLECDTLNIDIRGIP